MMEVNLHAPYVMTTCIKSIVTVACREWRFAGREQRSHVSEDSSRFRDEWIDSASSNDLDSRDRKFLSLPRNFFSRESSTKAASCVDCVLFHVAFGIVLSPAEQ